SWDWGDLSKQAFLPRISYKHIVLSRARWFLNGSVLIKWKNLSSVEDQKLLLKEYKLPKQVLIAEGDNELLIDFSSPLGMDILINKLKKGDVVLFEFISTHSASLVKDKLEQNYFHELITPFYSTVQTKPLLAIR